MLALEVGSRREEVTREMARAIWEGGVGGREKVGGLGGPGAVGCVRRRRESTSIGTAHIKMIMMSKAMAEAIKGEGEGRGGTDESMGG